MEVFLELIKQLGVPGGFAAGLLLLMWRLAKWMEPRASRLIDAHVETMKSVGESVREQTAASKETCQTLKELRATTEEIHAAVRAKQGG